MKIELDIDIKINGRHVAGYDVVGLCEKILRINYQVGNNEEHWSTWVNTETPQKIVEGYPTVTCTTASNVVGTSE